MSIQFVIAASMMMASHIMMGMGARNWSRKRRYLGTIFSGSSFLPYFSNRALASASVSPTWL